MPKAPVHTNFIRATLWTPTIKMEVSGGPVDNLHYLFCSLSLKQQTSLMNKLEKSYLERQQAEANKPPETPTPEA